MTADRPDGGATMEIPSGTWDWSIPSLSGRTEIHAKWTMPAAKLELRVGLHLIGIFTLPDADRYRQDLQDSLKGLEELARMWPKGSGEVVHAFDPGVGAPIRTVAYVRLGYSPEEEERPEATMLSLNEAQELCDSLSFIIDYIRWRVVNDRREARGGYEGGHLRPRLH